MNTFGIRQFLLVKLFLTLICQNFPLRYTVYVIEVHVATHTFRENLFTLTGWTIGVRIFIASCKHKIMFILIFGALVPFSYTMEIALKVPY